MKARSGTRGPELSATALAQVAVAIADSEGMAAVSMRRVARELGVTAMALYWHVADKDDLLDLMAEHVVTDARFRDPEGASWHDRYRAVVITLITLLREHPWMGRLVIERVVVLPNYLMALEIMLDCLAQAGTAEGRAAMIVQQTVQAAAAVVGDAPAAACPPAAGEAARRIRRQLQDELGGTTFPRVRAAAVPLTTTPEPEAYLRLGVEMIMGGVRACTS